MEESILQQLLQLYLEQQKHMMELSWSPELSEYVNSSNVYVLGSSAIAGSAEAALAAGG
jgi:fructoselysine-6-P-deglycase FrlB-like protein